MSWATEAEVLALTGTSVTAAQLSAAQGVIDVFSGVVVDATANLTIRDHRLLRMAVSYQAVWQAAQVDVTSRSDVKHLEQEGVEFDTAAADALFLAPLADRCLRQLSWKRTRSVRVCNGQKRWPTVEAYADAWLRDAEGGYRDWVPL